MIEILSSRGNISENLLLSELEWRERYDLLMDLETHVICRDQEVVETIEDEFRSSFLTVQEALDWNFLKDLVSREGTVILVLDRIDERFLAISGILGFLRVRYYWAGISVLPRYYDDQLMEDETVELRDDTYLQRSKGSRIIDGIDELSGDSTIVLVSNTFFQKNWTRFTPLFLPDNTLVKVKDGAHHEEIFLSVQRMMEICLIVIRVLRRLTEVEIVEILSNIPTIDWERMDRDLQTLFLYGVLDMGGYIALQNHYLRIPIQSINLFESSIGESMVLLDTIENGSITRHKLRLMRDKIQCSCTPFFPSIPCQGTILFLTKFRNYYSLNLNLWQIRKWLKGLGVISGLQHLGLLTVCTGKNSLEYKFEGEVEIYRYELTHTGRDIVRHGYPIDVFLAVRSTFHDSLEHVNGDDPQRLLELLLPLFPGRYTYDELLALLVSTSSRRTELSRILNVLTDLSFKYGLLKSHKKFREYYYKLRG